MEVIPVLDLKEGAVVHARMGRRAEYRPIKTPLATTSHAIDVARGLLSLYPFETFYIADLDAIERKGNNDAVLRGLRSAFPHLTFWVDNGLADLDRARCWLSAGLGQLVLGSETQKDDGTVRGLRADDRVILSLDYRDEFVGPAALLSDADAWPSRIIAMTLARVGNALGPDFDRLSAIRGRVADKRVYAAGGIRGADDLIALASVGIAGALVASCLHDGKLSGEQIATMAGVQ
jgi:phosphoribosylformimino-5-aminoimidazole carboxamide ribotide isomerase